MKKILLLVIAALAIVACEKQKKVADAKDMEISFEYRNIQTDSLHSFVPHFEFRNTTTPEYTRPDFWWYFKGGTGDIAPFIGETGDRYVSIIDTYNVTLQYKPAVEPDPNAVLAERTFTINITGVADSVWHTAVPK